VVLPGGELIVMGASANDALLLLTGQGGLEIVTDTTARTGDWRRLHALSTASVTLTVDGDTYSTVTVTAGSDIFGKISAVTLGSGGVVLYK
jgi:hypothetical protein